MAANDPIDVTRLREALAAGRFEWRRHALERMAERRISQAAALHVLQWGECIEDYPEDRPYASGLFLGWFQGKPLHLLAALDQQHDWAYVITVYEPDLEHFEADYRTRRSP